MKKLNDNQSQTAHSASEATMKNPHTVEGDLKARRKKTIVRRTKVVIFLLSLLLVFVYLAWVMGAANMLNTIMQTSYHLLLETVLYIMAITVISGALGNMLVEFGVVRAVERMLRPLMRPLFNLPGSAALGAILTFLSDNPAIITLSKDKNFARYFKKYQLISLTNFGTAFGMGLIVILFMTSKGFMSGALIGFVGAIIGSIISTRLMQRFILKNYPKMADNQVSEKVEEQQVKESGDGILLRFLNSILDGGKSGVEIGMSIIPGVLIISTVVMMMTFGEPAGGYSGGAYEGVPILSYLAEKFDTVLYWLFGFEHPQLVAFPITSLGAVGAALGLVPKFIEEGIVTNNAIAVFTAMGMCWSGYLSTHAAMLDTLGHRELISKAILAHTIGGLMAGVIAHWLYQLVSLI